MVARFFKEPKKANSVSPFPARIAPPRWGTRGRRCDLTAYPPLRRCAVSGSPACPPQDESETRELSGRLTAPCQGNFRPILLSRLSQTHLRYRRNKRRVLANLLTVTKTTGGVNGWLFLFVPQGLSQSGGRWEGGFLRRPTLSPDCYTGSKRGSGHPGVRGLPGPKIGTFTPGTKTCPRGPTGAPGTRPRGWGTGFVLGAGNAGSVGTADRRA